MGDVVALFTEVIFVNWQLLLIGILAPLAVLPWIGLFALNFFNKNVWAEIRATADRSTVKVFRIKQSGQSEILYRKMNPDRTITLSENKDTGEKDDITPTTSPHPDINSHRHLYVTVEGQEGTKNLLEDTKYDVNSPQKKMTYTMAFESGREFERVYSTKNEDFNWLPLIQLGLPTFLLIIAILLIWSQNGMINAIAKAVGV